MRKQTTPKRAVWQLKVTLLDILPPIWRRAQLWEDTGLGQLHQVLQVVIGWEDCHLHEFVIGDRRYGPPDDELETIDERPVRLNQVVGGVGTEFEYHYDFGDDWRHSLVLESILIPDSGAHYPRCTAGERSGPPEDCGGPYGYEEYLEALANPRHERHEELLEWRGPFDPEAFSLDSINRQLRGIRNPRGKSSTPSRTPTDLARVLASSPEFQELARKVFSVLSMPQGLPERKKILPGEKVPIELSERERELILHHSFADPDLTRRLLVVPKKGQPPVYHYTLDELDELAGYVAAEANHAKERKLQREGYQLHARITDVLDAYTDED